ncbi:MAG: hypothetical protein JOZ58_00150, partial [Acetobacteraceae bacterium]|nr:hypothetical protein [Acetobacteraceae bacterium]
MATDNNTATGEDEREAEAGSPSGPFPGVIVTIGALATDTDSLVRVLAGLRVGSGLAVVLTLRHREAFVEDTFRTALGAQASALQPVAEGAPVEAGGIYLPTPEVDVSLVGGRFTTRAVSGRPAERGTIDSVFSSIARDQDGRTIGILLAGLGDDGTLGVVAIKEAGGLTIAEASSGTETDDLAPSHGLAALVDHILPAAE